MVTNDFLRKRITQPSLLSIALITYNHFVFLFFFILFFYFRSSYHIQQLTQVSTQYKLQKLIGEGWGLGKVFFIITAKRIITDYVSRRSRGTHKHNPRIIIQRPIRTLFLGFVRSRYQWVVLGGISIVYNIIY